MLWLRVVAASIAVSQLAAAAPRVMAQTALDGDSAVVETFQDARAAGDLSGALAQFRDDAIVTVQTGRSTQIFSGHDQIRVYLQTVALPSRALMHSGYRSDGTFVRWTERDEDARQTSDNAAQATIESGRISMLLVNRSEPFPSQVGATTSSGDQTPSVPSIAWAAALGTGLMLLLGLVFRPRRRRSASVLDGRLVRAMRQAHVDDRRAA